MIQSSLFHVQNRTGQYVCMNYQIGAGAQISSRFKFGDNLTMHTGSSKHRFPCLFIFIFNFSCLYLYSPRCLIHSIELSLSSRSTRRDHGSQPGCLCFAFERIIIGCGFYLLFRKHPQFLLQNPTHPSLEAGEAWIAGAREGANAVE